MGSDGIPVAVVTVVASLGQCYPGLAVFRMFTSRVAVLAEVVTDVVVARADITLEALANDGKGEAVATPNASVDLFVHPAGR